MKRLLLGLIILGAGSGIFGAARSVTIQLSRDAEGRRAAGLAQSEPGKSAEAEVKQLHDRVQGLKSELQAQRSEHTASLSPDETVPEAGPMSPETSERLLAALGFSWNTSGDYVVVSKETLHKISLTGIKEGKLTPIACGALAITPAERALVDGLLAEVSSEYAAWATAHVQRDDPGTNFLAKYELPEDAAFSLSLSNTITAGMAGILGQQRSGLLLDYSASWRNDLSLVGHGAKIFSVELFSTARTPDGVAPTYSYDLYQVGGGGQRRMMVTPNDPFPAAFQPIFPGGWAEVAQREGFPLPRSFSNPAVAH